MEEFASDEMPENLNFSSQEQQVRVILRIRPLNDKELIRRDTISVEALTHSTCILSSNTLSPPMQLKFDTVFGESVSQEDIYINSGITNLVDKATEGYAATVFAYGQTGSGKSYTITGPHTHDQCIDPLHPEAGLVARTLNYLHEQIKSKIEMKVTMKASYYEIYNENVRDLLRPINTSLSVRWSVETGFFVENLFMVDCEVLDDFLVVLEEGLRNRKTAAHNMNSHSSRSHSILTVYISSESTTAFDAKGIPIQRVGQISFVDLAGSEKVKETKTSGESLTETMNINKSLLTLGSCIAALSDSKKKDGHIPYRDSKLTKILYDSLGGNGYVLMIACISPSSYSISETQSTLRYAQRAKHITAIPMIKTNSPQEEIISRLKRDLKNAKTELSSLRSAIGDDSYEEILRNSRRSTFSNVSLQSSARSRTNSYRPQAASGFSYSSGLSNNSNSGLSRFSTDYQYDSSLEQGFTADSSRFPSEGSLNSYSHRVDNSSKNVKLMTEKRNSLKQQTDSNTSRNSRRSY